jgi:hypothetical protein
MGAFKEAAFNAGTSGNTHGLAQSFPGHVLASDQQVLASVADAPGKRLQRL